MQGVALRKEYVCWVLVRRFRFEKKPHHTHLIPKALDRKTYYARIRNLPAQTPPVGATYPDEIPSIGVVPHIFVVRLSIDSPLKNLRRLQPPHPCHVFAATRSGSLSPPSLAYARRFCGRAHCIRPDKKMGRSRDTNRHAFVAREQAEF